MSKFLSVSERSFSFLSRTVNKIVEYLTITTTILFLLIVFIGVISRYVLGASLIFSVELSKMLFVWSCFLAATIAYKQKCHIRFEFLNQIFGNRGLALTDMLLYVCSLAFFTLVLKYAIDFTKIIWKTYLPVMNLSQGWLYMAVVISSGVFILHTINLLIESLKELVKVFSQKEGASI